MINLLFIFIICLIIIKTIIDNNTINNNDINKNNFKIINKNINKNYNYNINKKITSNLEPWSRILNNSKRNYNIYCIKIKIPSLNDLENWKALIPDINFNNKTEEIEIPSENEPRALAIANLIYANFMGQISIINIIDKDLLNISINKAQQYKLVSTKLKDQLIEKLFNNKSITNIYNKDLAVNNENTTDFPDNFINNDINNNNLIEENETIEAYQGGDYAYI